MCRQFGYDLYCCRAIYFENFQSVSTHERKHYAIQIDCPQAIRKERTKNSPRIKRGEIEHRKKMRVP